MAGASEQELRTLEERLDSDGIHGLWIVFHDYSARACAKWVPREAVPGALRRGGVFATANLNFSIDDVQAEQPHFAAQTGDFFAVPDPSTYAPVPYRAGIGRVLSYLHTEAGELWEGCPRGRLAAQIAALAERGFSLRAAFEPEFSLFHKTEDGRYVPTDRFYMYSVDRVDANADLMQAIETALAAQGVRVVQIGSEYGMGQLEINLHHEVPLKAADDLVTFRETVKALARVSASPATRLRRVAAPLPRFHARTCENTPQPPTRGEETHARPDRAAGCRYSLSPVPEPGRAHTRGVCGSGRLRRRVRGLHG